MIIHSIVPIDLIFNNSENGDTGKTLEIEYLGETVQVSPLTNNQYVISRLISTSPKAYLNPKLQPGSVVYLRAD